MVNYPKAREIFAADFTDRIVHHLLINAIEKYFEKRFIFDSYACRREKGTHNAAAKTLKFIRTITNNKTRNAYYLQLDIRSFFPDLDKNILFKIIKREVLAMKKGKNWKSDILWLSRVIIYHDPTANYQLKSPPVLMRKIPRHKSLFGKSNKKGLPIGNLTSQFFANVYLNELDQFIKRKLKVKYYIRYVDDLLLLSENKDQLKSWRKEINNFLIKKLKLSLHPQKDHLRSVYQGIDFLGYVIFPSHVLVRKRVVDNLKTKLYNLNQNKLPPSLKEIEKTTALLNSYFGHFRKANSYSLRKVVYKKHLGKYKKFLKPQNDLLFFAHLSHPDSIFPISSSRPIKNENFL